MKLIKTTYDRLDYSDEVEALATPPQVNSQTKKSILEGLNTAQK